MIARSYLFVPGCNESMVRKALGTAADAIILDLEDAVPADLKARARETVARTLRQRSVIVRVNRPRSTECAADIDAVADHASALRLPKCESPDEVAWVAERAPGTPLICAIESARGVLAAPEIAMAPNVTNLGIGLVDLRNDLRAGPGETPMLYARSALVVASSAAAIDPPIDGVYPHVRDLAELESETRSARQLGYLGKGAIHPGQLDILNRVFTPDDDEIAWARKVIAANRNSAGAPTTLDDGEFVDLPVVTRATRILRVAHHAHDQPC